MRAAFHTGELQVQRLAGTRGVADELGAFLSDHLNLNSGVSTFFSSLRLVWLTTLTPAYSTTSGDSRPRVWVTPAFGEPGFVSAQSETLVSIKLSHDVSHDEILASLAPSAPISFLAIDFEARARYRTNGVVKSFNRSSMELQIFVKEAFPNCPKYIQKRTLSPESENTLATSKVQVREADFVSQSLNKSDKYLLANTDTLFLGTYYEHTGPDTNHRGGTPGFVRILSDQELFFPDYRGNGMFQSFGNLQVNDRAGLTVLDFTTGAVLRLTGRATLDWNVADSISNIEGGANRGLRFHVEQVRRSNGPGTSLRWQLEQASPYNPSIDMDLDESVDGFPMRARLVKVVQESRSVKTFRFLTSRRIPFLPGQYATFEFLQAAGDCSGEVRTWTLSEVANSTLGDVTLEVTVKRKEGGKVSSYLHDQTPLGMDVLVRGIGGEMTPFRDGRSLPKKFLFISGGIGITPNMAILRGFGARTDAADERGKEGTPDVIFLHQERYIQDMPFQKELKRRKDQSFGRMKLVVFETRPGDQQTKDGSMDMRNGRINEESIQELVPDIDEREIYLCGPPAFMEAMQQILVEKGAEVDNIVTEKFDF